MVLSIIKVIHVFLYKTADLFSEVHEKKAGQQEERTMRLLLAEDEKALSKALTAILERNNYSVDARL